MNSNFLTRQNVDLLWEVITEEDIIKDQDKTTLDELRNLFASNLKPFYEARKNDLNNLMDMNRTYIGLLQSHVRRMYRLTPTRKGANQFERDLSMKQNEFSSAMSKPVPPTPNFSDAAIETPPMSEIEIELKRMQQQRNYDIEQVSKNYNTNSSYITNTNNNMSNGSNNNSKAILPTNATINSNTNSWLTPKETSLKSEKIHYLKISDKEESNSILKKDIIDLNSPRQEKHISWQDLSLTQTKSDQLQNIHLEIQDNELETTNTESLFKKLKKLPPINNLTEEVLKEKEKEKEDLVETNNAFLRKQHDEDIKQLSLKVDKILEILSRLNL